MPEFANQVVGLFKRAASEQGGLLSGKDPTEVNFQDPIRLWIIQIGVIVCTASLLALGLRKLRQPKVIAEVLGGIILGPTAFGRIPGFTEHIFPQDSRSYLSLTANIGLCLFLFLVGLEIDAGVIKRNARLSAMVALAGMVIPFGFGAALAVPLYQRFIPSDVEFTHFMLFTGVAYSITAFPVLCRILTELKLLDTTVGIVVLSAGVGNDIVGWTLLALSVALVNAGSGLMALWILLTCVGWTLFILIPVKMTFFWLAKKTGSIESGPTVFFMTATMMLVFGSAFFTDVIGVHAIFGAFLAGLIVPREGGLAIALTEKLEDMVAIIFLPLYFTLSGLSTDLGLLNDGVTWGYTIAIMVLAFVGKFGGCTLAAKYAAGFNWRESSTIGSLMSCKGLVELIVLNVGLSAGILTPRVFSMFVLEALVLTFMTTPLVTWLYPPKYRTRIAKTGANFANVADDEANVNTPGKRGNKSRKVKDNNNKKRKEGKEGEGDGTVRSKFVLVLDRLEHLPGALALAQLISPSCATSLESEEFEDRDEEELELEGRNDEKKKVGTVDNELQLKRKSTSKGVSLSSTDSISSIKSSSTSSSSSYQHPLIITALRLIKLTDRVSVVMKSQDLTSLLHTDPLLSIFRMFALLQGIDVRGEVEVVPEGEMAQSVLEKTGIRMFGDEEDEQMGLGEGEMVLVPWVVHSHGGSEGDRIQSQPQTPRAVGDKGYNPFENLFMRAGTSASGTHTPANPDYTHAAHVERHAHFAGAPSTSNYNLTQNASVTHSHFLRSVFANSEVDVGLFIDQSSLYTPSRNIGVINSGGGLRKRKGEMHLFVPFFGGPDDRLTLEFVVGLCRRNEKLRATIVRFTKVVENVPSATQGPGGESSGIGEAKAVGDRNEELNAFTVASNIAGFPDTVYGHAGTEVMMQSETADNIIWTRYARRSHIPPTTTRPSASSEANLPEGDITEEKTGPGNLKRDSSSASSSKNPTPPPPTLPSTQEPSTQSDELLSQGRIVFKEVSSAKPLHAALDEAIALQAPYVSTSSSRTRRNKNRYRKEKTRGIVIVTGRSRRLAVESHREELNEILKGGSSGESHEIHTHTYNTNVEGGMAREVRKTVGEVGSAFVVRGIGIGVWVLQAALTSGER